MSERWPMFSVEQDNQLIADGTHFWCHTHLTARPLAELPPDPRYCKECYEFLLKEAELLKGAGNKHRPAWMPMVGSEKGRKGSATIQGQGSTIMSTVNDKNIEVDIIPPPVATRPLPKRGPKFLELPDNLIKKLAAQGMGSKSISAELTKQGYAVSYKTIQRRMQGVLV